MKIIAINLTTTGRVAGGAAIAAKLLSGYIYKNFNGIELWRMWDESSIEIEEGFKIRNFKTTFVIDKLRKILPKKFVKLFLRSDILRELKMKSQK